MNEKAVSTYKKYLTLYPPVGGNDFLYIIHNLHMQTNHAMMEPPAERIRPLGALVRSQLLPEG